MSNYKCTELQRREPMVCTFCGANVTWIASEQVWRHAEDNPMKSIFCDQRGYPVKRVISKDAREIEAKLNDVSSERDQLAERLFSAQCSVATTGDSLEKAESLADELAKALELTRQTLNDLEAGFSPAVNPLAWVIQVQKPINEALAKYHATRKLEG